MCASLHIAKDTWFFNKKKELKGHVDKTFITENLTRHRYDLLKRLNTLRVDRKIHSFWTHDGSVFVKETERSRPLVVKIAVNIINKPTHFDNRTGNYSLLDPILITDSISIIDSDTIIL